MGNKKSRPFEYQEQILYLSDQYLSSYNINTQQTKTLYKITNYGVLITGIRFHEKNSTISISSNGLKTITIVAHFNNAYHFEVFDHKMKRIDYKIYQITDKDTRVRPIDIMRKENIDINFNLESFQKRPLPVLTDYQVHYTDDNKIPFWIPNDSLVLLMRPFSWYPNILYHDHIQNMCYDKYDDTCIIAKYDTRDQINQTQFIIYQWNDGWVEKCKSLPINVNGTYYPSLVPKVTYRIYHLEATRHNIIVGIANSQGLYRISFIDKYKLEMAGYLYAYVPAYRDYYEDWLNDNLKVLMGVKKMRGLSKDLLKIVLSYVG
jgi:hypothetical protein